MPVVYYKFRTLHSSGYSGWEWDECDLGDNGTWEAAQEEITGEISDKHNWSEHFRRVEIERVDVPPKEWVVEQIGRSKRQIQYARERIHRLRLLQRRIPILGYDTNDAALYEGRIPIDQRPHVGETWKNLVGDEVIITGVDPYGRSFSYQRSRPVWGVAGKLTQDVVNGDIGQSDVLDGKAVKVKP